MARIFTPVHVAALQELDHVVEQTQAGAQALHLEPAVVADGVRSLLHRVSTEIEGQPALFTPRDAGLLHTLAWEWIDDAPAQGVGMPLPARIALGQTLLDLRDVIAERVSPEAP